MASPSPSPPPPLLLPPSPLPPPPPPLCLPLSSRLCLGLFSAVASALLSPCFCSLVLRPASSLPLFLRSFTSGLFVVLCPFLLAVVSGWLLVVCLLLAPRVVSPPPFFPSCPSASPHVLVPSSHLWLPQYVCSRIIVSSYGFGIFVARHCGTLALVCLSSHCLGMCLLFIAGSHRPGMFVYKLQLTVSFAGTLVDTTTPVNCSTS